jgi:hypothetical protein
VKPYFENAIISFLKIPKLIQKRGRTLLYQDGVGNRGCVKERPMSQRKEFLNVKTDQIS